MKKKLKDLTTKEMEQICDEHWERMKRCAGCKLNLGNDHCLKYVDLDQEIEVESDVDKAIKQIKIKEKYDYLDKRVIKEREQ